MEKWLILGPLVIYLKFMPKNLRIIELEPFKNDFQDVIIEPKSPCQPIAIIQPVHHLPVPSPQNHLL